MPYQTVGGTPERASRLGHSQAVIRATASERSFYVPAEHVQDMTWLAPLVHQRPAATPAIGQLELALAIDGSHMGARVRDGIPSVVYGFAQTAAALINLSAMELAHAERFPDPVKFERAVTAELVTVDLPIAGAYSRQGVTLKTSWRECLYEIFKTKSVDIGGGPHGKTLLELLMHLHGTPTNPGPSTPVKCIRCETQDIPVPPAGCKCPGPGGGVPCGEDLYPTDVLRIHEEVSEQGSNETALGRLMSVVELLVLAGIVTLVWERSRSDVLRKTLFILDGPMAVYGTPAKLSKRALDYFQSMFVSTGAVGPFICGIEKSGGMVDFGEQLAAHDVLKPGEVLECDHQVISEVVGCDNPIAYGENTYWGRKFIYRAFDGRVVVPTVMPDAGDPYDKHGGQSSPTGYSTLSHVLDVVERTGSSMYHNGIIPVATAHGKAAFPIGVGTDVLKIASQQLLGL